MLWGPRLHAHRHQLQQPAPQLRRRRLLRTLPSRRHGRAARQRGEAGARLVDSGGGQPDGAPTAGLAEHMQPTPGQPAGFARGRVGDLPGGGGEHRAQQQGRDVLPGRGQAGQRRPGDPLFRRPEAAREEPGRGAVAGRCRGAELVACAVGESFAILLHPPLSLAGVPIVMERERHQNSD